MDLLLEIEALNGIEWTPQAGREWNEYKTRLATHGPRLEVLDVHFYRTRKDETVTDAFARDLESVRFVEGTAAGILKGKPVILGEFGVFRFAETSWTTAQKNLMAIRDEAMRHSITKMSHLHFVAAEPYRQRVIQLGEHPDRVFLVGGLGVDAIKRTSLLGRSELEADLAHINRVSLLGELAASIAHEVGQPLSGVVSNGGACLRWLAREVPNLEEAREAAKRIVRDGKRAGEIIAKYAKGGGNPDDATVMVDPAAPAGYQPVITVLPSGAFMSAIAVISADRRYVRVSPMPFFSGVTQVNTFNTTTGSSGTSNGGGSSTGFSGLGGGASGGGGIF